MTQVWGLRGERKMSGRISRGPPESWGREDNGEKKVERIKPGTDVSREWGGATEEEKERVRKT